MFIFSLFSSFFQKYYIFIPEKQSSVHISMHKDIKIYTVTHCTLYARTKLRSVRTASRNLVSPKRRYRAGVVSDGQCLSTV
jgi:hypothetical protein